MDLNWNRNVSKEKEQQEALKKKMHFSYVGHGPRATGFLSKTFKRKPGLYARCPQCDYYMPLDAQGTEVCLCGSLTRTPDTLTAAYGEEEVEIFKAAALR
ncbi:MAG: hypothetical protein LKJ90_04700 [Faecalibacterium sp.]|jgi:hypothetical protein|nr:hypothetical protein [Faecalibacterium sp.]